MNYNSLYKELVENVSEGIYFVDSKRKITFWNKGAEIITGFSSEEVLNSYCYDNILNHVNEEGKNLCKDGCPLYKTINTGESLKIDVYLQHKNGERIPIWVKSIPLYEDDKIIGAIEIFNDYSEKMKMQKELEKLKIIANIDQLTKLPNRRYIDAIMDSKINELSSLKIPFGIAFIDIDKFKIFNDTYGHDIGDEILKMVARTFKNNVISPHFVGRWGGEEFIIIYQNINKTELFELSQKIRALIEKSILKKDNKNINVTISLGSTMATKEDTIESIIKRADDLLYKSKSSGRNRVTID